VPLGTFFALLCIWFLVSFPLVWVGVWLGYRRPLADPPVKTNMVPRVVPVQAWYLHPIFTMVVGGILPFGAVFIELYFIMSSVWLQRFYPPSHPIPSPPIPSHSTSSHPIPSQVWLQRFYYVFGFLALVRPGPATRARTRARHADARWASPRPRCSTRGVGANRRPSCVELTALWAVVRLHRSS
jgi:hypothetical protein